MLEAPLKDQNNQNIGTVQLEERIFGREVREDILARMVHYQLAKRRLGTADTKRRSEVHGGGRKPYRQKGTGNARQGTIRAPHYRKGGVVFGPHPRDFAGKLPKKVRRLALMTALSAKLAAQEIIFVNSLTFSEIKTKLMIKTMADFAIDGSLMIVLGGRDANIELSARNIPNVQVLPAEGVNVYDLLWHKQLIMTESGLKAIQERLA